MSIDKNLYLKKINKALNGSHPTHNEMKVIDDYDFVTSAKKESSILRGDYLNQIQLAKDEAKYSKQAEIKTSLDASVKIQMDLQKDYDIEKAKKVKVRKTLESFWKNQTKIKELKKSLYL